MQIKDRLFVITGGARGLGAAMARKLASHGAKLALFDMNEEQLQSTCEELGDLARGYVVNVADEKSVEEGFQAVLDAQGTPDGLINNAGIIRDGLLIKAKDGKVTDKLSLRKWQSVIDVNLTGVFLCTREAAANMVETGTRGVIINISSISKSGNMGQTNYTAAKAGVAAMTVTWAKELARYGIRVASISPGFTNTEMVASMPEEALGKIKNVIPLRRLAEPEQMAETVRFIIENDYMTGRDIAVDGGLRL